MAGEYFPRIIDRELTERLKSTGAVLIEGARATGKTMTARHASASEVLLDTDENARAAVQVDPGLILKGEVPRLIDEWQIEPSIWNHIRRTVDDRGTPGQFILTGSAQPADDITRHTGAGRIARLRMRPMTLFESGRSSGEVSLRDIMDGKGARAAGHGLEFKDLTSEILRGGWPWTRNLPLSNSQQAVRDYLREITHLDLSRIEGAPRFDPDRVNRLLRSLARNISTEATVATLSRDTSSRESAALRSETVAGYLSALEQVMVIENQPAWAPHLRSRYALRRMPKRHFTDPSLAAAALRASPSGLARDLRLTGLLFESLAIRDLRVYAQANDGVVMHYRDSDGLEADAIVELADGRWAAFEVKMGVGAIDQAAANLLKLARRVDTDACGEPAALAVIVATGLAYTREDGVQVIPIGSLGP